MQVKAAQSAGWLSNHTATVQSIASLQPGVVQVNVYEGEMGGKSVNVARLMRRKRKEID